MLTMMLPLVSQEIRRDKEEELIFRGLQYAEAIRVFQMRYQRLPNKLSELVEVKPRSIRQLWKDPMTDDGKWGLIFLNQGQPINPQQPGQPGQPGKPGQPGQPGQPQQPGEEGGGQEGSDQGGGLGVPKPGDTVQIGPIVGVYSKSHKKSILIFNGRERYDEWQFRVEMLASQMKTFNGVGVGEGGPVLSTRWLGRPMRFNNSNGLPSSVQNGTMPDGSQPGGGGFKPVPRPGGRPPGQGPTPKPKPFGRP
jgi:hypothetical protein